MVCRHYSDNQFCMALWYHPSPGTQRGLNFFPQGVGANLCLQGGATAVNIAGGWGAAASVAITAKEKKLSLYYFIDNLQFSQNKIIWTRSSGFTKSCYFCFDMFLNENLVKKILWPHELHGCCHGYFNNGSFMTCKFISF